MRTRSCLFVPTRFFHGKEGVVGSSPTEGLADFQGFYQDRRAAEKVSWNTRGTRYAVS
jgi:hypothetical protein